MQFKFDRTEAHPGQDFPDRPWVPGQLIVRNLKCTFDDGTELAEDLYIHDAKHEDGDDPDGWSIASEKYVMDQIKARVQAIVDAYLGTVDAAPAPPPFSGGGTFNL